MLRLFLIAVVGALVVVSCSSDQQPATVENAEAAYVHVSSDVFENDAVVDPLTKAVGDEPAEPAGFIRGLRSAGSKVTADGVYGWAFIFQSDVTPAQREVLASRAESFGLEIIWLRSDDEWPWCEGEEQCRVPSDSGNFP